MSKQTVKHNNASDLHLETLRNVEILENYADRRFQELRKLKDEVP